MKKRNENTLFIRNKEKINLTHNEHQINSDKPYKPALANLDQNEIKKTIDLFLELQKTIAEAQFNLGLIYYQNRYVNIDILKSIYYFSLAAEQNHVQSQLILAQIYFENKYIKQDIHNVIHYYKLTAEQNNAEAQFNLGLIYFESRFVTGDLINAIKFFSLAANQNHQNAILYLNNIQSK